MMFSHGMFQATRQNVFGANWRDKLRIPPKAPVLDPKVYKNDAYSFSLRVNQYHLLLAKKGKIDNNIKFAECIESQLFNAGVRGIRLVLELDMMHGTRRRASSEVCGGNIKIESLCHHPTHRLWEDYIQK